MITLYKPVVSPKQTSLFTYAPRPKDLKGKRIGLINTSKVNADLFLKRIEDLFLSYGISNTVNIRKLSPGYLLRQDQLSELQENADAAVIAFGD